MLLKNILICCGLCLYTFPAIFAQITNDICSDAITLIADGSCSVYNNTGATPSNLPSDRFNCGDRSFVASDIWFKAVSPASGNMSIETYRYYYEDITTDLEVYKGTCTNLIVLACKAGYNYDETRIELEQLTPSETIYIRVIGALNRQGDFNICVKDEAPQSDCTIDLVEVGNQSSCDPDDNTFDQELIITYKSPVEVEIDISYADRVNSFNSPQMVVLSDLPATGQQFDLNINLHQTDYSGPCNYFDDYELSNAFVGPENCYESSIDNDECVNAISLSVGDELVFQQFDLTGANPSTHLENPCGHNDIPPQDVWFQFVMPDTDVLISMSNFNYIATYIQVYLGPCSAPVLIEDCSNGSLQLSRPAGETIFVRVSTRYHHKQGLFELAVAKVPAIVNDVCIDAFDLGNEESCSPLFYDDDAHAEYFPSFNHSCNSDDTEARDLWFKMTVFTTSEFYISVQENFRSTMAVEVFEGACSGLTLVSCDVDRDPIIELDNRTIGEELYIRVAGAYGGSKAYKVCILSRPENDICDGAIDLPVNGSCLMAYGRIASASNNPSVNLECGFQYVPSKDLWYSVVVPANGKLRVETKGNDVNTTIAAYQGQCSDLDLLSCDNRHIINGSYIYNGLLELENLTPNDIIWIRVVSDNGKNFEICASDEGYLTSCAIDKVELISAENCDPATNTFSATLEVHYRDDGSNSTLRIENSSYPLTSSPMQVTVNDLLANGAMISLDLDLESNSYNDCTRNSSYRAFELIQAPTNCFDPPLANDDCHGAILIDVDTTEVNFISYDMTGASTSVFPGSDEFCLVENINGIQDVWFKFVMGDKDVVVSTDYDGISPMYEIFFGTCDDLIRYENCSGNSDRSQRISRPSGDTVHIRIAEESMSRQGEFELAVFEVEDNTNDICDTAIELLVNDSLENKIYSNHLSINENSIRASCDDYSIFANDVWYSIITPQSGRLQILVEDIENVFAYNDFVLEAYRGSCNSPTKIACDRNSGSRGYPMLDLDNLTPNELIFLRVSTSYYNAKAFTISAISLANDICEMATLVGGQDSSFTYSTQGATSSNHPTEYIHCGYFYSTNDIWFKMLVPSSGTVSFYASSSDIEAYHGDCSSLSSIMCSSEGPIALFGRTPGEVIYIRVIPDGNYIESLQITVNSYSDDYCSINLIELGQQSACDPSSNSFQQELIVHYDTSNAVSSSELLINGLSYPISGSPQVVSIQLPAFGSPIDIEASIDNCDSYYYSQDYISGQSNCANFSVANDDCQDAIHLEVFPYEQKEVFNTTGATSRGQFNGCRANEPSVWFKFKIPQSGVAVVSSHSGDIDVQFDLLTGSCDNLSRLSTCGGYRDLAAIGTPGQEIFISVGDNGNDAQGIFYISVFELTEDRNISCELAEELPVLNECINGSFGTFRNEGNTAYEGVNCSYGVEGVGDVWFKLIVPPSGTLDLTTSALGTYQEMSLQVFEGMCSDLTEISCDRASSTDNLPQISISGRTPGETLFLRSGVRIPWRPGAFRLCATNSCPDSTFITGNIYQSATLQASGEISGDAKISKGTNLILSTGIGSAFSAGLTVDTTATLEVNMDGCQ